MPEQRQYSDQTSELLGKVPSWVVRWGITVIFVIFAGLIVGSFLIKYPQIITAPVTITTVNPPADLIAKASGRIDSLFAADGQLLAPGAPVALLQNTARYEDAIEVEEHLETFAADDENEWLERDYAVGELQGAFSEFRQQVRAFRHYIGADHLAQKKRLLEGQIAQYRKYLKQLQAQRPLQREDLRYAEANFRRDSALFAQSVISPLEFERSAQARVQKKSAVASFEASLTTTELTVLQMEQQLLELTFQQQNDTQDYRTRIDEGRTRLAAQILQWRQTYVLSAPTAGRLSYTKYWSRNQNVAGGDKLASVVPQDSARVVGLMQVPSAGFGRVAIGQTVYVKLNGYPYYEYGRLKGQVVRVSSVPDAEGYVVEVAFPDGLQSTYKEQLRLIQQMDGVGEIVTRDQRLIERFIQPLRALFDKVS